MKLPGTLQKDYTFEFSVNDLNNNIEDLIYRFQNKALRDTIFRVGRDLSQKLEKIDRLIGGFLLCIKYKLPCDTITSATVAGFFFKTYDEDNKLFCSDEKFFQELDSACIESVLQNICHLDLKKETENRLVKDFSLYYNKYK